MGIGTDLPCLRVAGATEGSHYVYLVLIGTTTVFPKLQKVVLKSGDEISISDGVTVIVGPNNVGKSLLLREVQTWMAGPVYARTPLKSIMLQDVVLGTWPDADKLMTWLELRYPRRQPGRYSYGQTISEHFLLQNDEQITVEEIRAICRNQESSIANLAYAYALYLGLADRLTVAGSTATQNILTEYPQHPIHYLYRYRELEAQVNDSMERVFGMRLTVNRYGGQRTTLHVGEVLAAETVPASEAYIQEIMSLPQIQDQGDGVRAFIGIFLSIITALRPLIIIDEPEAFLHPPQAYLLGRILAEQYSHDAQVLIATHSHDLMRGLTSAKSSAETVTVARITRHESTENRVHQVSADKIRDLYQDPVTRYYSMLDGLFFHGVILCESDSDCTYYRAVFESNGHAGDDRPRTPTDLHFTHCGGKARLPKAVSALRAAGVPFACAVDFDFLQDDYNFRDLVISCGGQPSTLQARRNVVVAAVTAKDRKLRRATAKSEIEAVLDASDSPDVSAKELRRIGAVLKATSGWREAKLVGRGLLSGDAVTAFDSLDADLRALGIFVVVVGELERFHPQIPSDNKAAWLRRVLEDELYAGSVAAREYVAAMVSSIAARQ
jgi:hypothetical protein